MKYIVISYREAILHNYNFTLQAASEKRYNTKMRTKVHKSLHCTCCGMPKCTGQADVT